VPAGTAYFKRNRKLENARRQANQSSSRTIQLQVRRIAEASLNPYQKSGFNAVLPVSCSNLARYYPHAEPRM
jgi:hypothetical protein